MSTSPEFPEDWRKFFVPDTSAPRESSGEMRQAAAAMHELFAAFIDVGFTEDQSMELVKTALIRAM